MAGSKAAPAAPTTTRNRTRCPRCSERRAIKAPTKVCRSCAEVLSNAVAANRQAVDEAKAAHKAWAKEARSYGVA